MKSLQVFQGCLTGFRLAALQDFAVRVRDRREASESFGFRVLGCMVDYIMGLGFRAWRVGPRRP